jgi:hypothetical protein
VLDDSPPGRVAESIEFGFMVIIHLP